MLDRLGWNSNLITIFLASVFSLKRGARIVHSKGFGKDQR